MHDVSDVEVEDPLVLIEEAKDGAHVDLVLGRQLLALRLVVALLGELSWLLLLLILHFN